MFCPKLEATKFDLIVYLKTSYPRTLICIHVCYVHVSNFISTLRKLGVYGEVLVRQPVISFKIVYNFCLLACFNKLYKIYKVNVTINNSNSAGLYSLLQLLLLCQLCMFYLTRYVLFCFQ